MVGAAAFSGAVTHTASVGIIAFEMTGQITVCFGQKILYLTTNIMFKY